MSVDVSVVIPVYNTEAYLPQCIESLLGQTLRNVEFIFVDDGSTDRSAEIIEDYQKRDGRITLLRQKNQYAGTARNNGMRAATGKYLLFVDSDDFFKPNMLEAAFRCAEKHRAEITVFDFCYYDQATHKVKPMRHLRLPKGVFSPEELGGDLFEYNHYNGAPWNKLFLRSFIEEQGLLFQETPKYNDIYFTRMAAVLAKRMAHRRKVLIYYRINNSASLQGRSDYERALFIMSCAEIKREMKARGKFYGSFRDAYNNYALSLIPHNGRFASGDCKSAQAYYTAVKENLVPILFDEEKDIAHDPAAMRLYNSSSYEAYLFEELIRLRNNTAFRQNWDYRLGHALLLYPKKLLAWLRVTL